MMPSHWTKAVIRVGGGRGFVVGTDRERLVITAAHCLPRFPPCLSFSRIEERTYAKLLGRIERKRTPVWAECSFVDPIADLAVLWSPDNQALFEEAEAYETLVDAAIPLPIGELPLTRSPVSSSIDQTILGPPSAECEGWLLSLDGRWFRCEVTAGNRALTVAKAADKITVGMSGSPIMSDDGKAIGVVVSNPGDSAQPFLSRQLPRWLLDKICAG